MWILNYLSFLDIFYLSTLTSQVSTLSSLQDGSAVEIVGLSYACLKRLAELNKQGLYSYSGVKREEVKWSLADWAEKIEKNFEAHYFIQEGNPKERRNGKLQEVDFEGYLITRPSLSLLTLLQTW